MEKKKHILDFRVPKEYFEDFDAKLLQKISKENLPENSGFIIPENYFDSVEIGILQKINKEKPLGKLISLNIKRRIGYAAAIAASAVIIFSITDNNNQADDIESLSYANLENYIDEGNLDMSTYDVLALLDDSTVNNISFDNTMFAPDVLEDYILETMDEAILTEE